ncbi:hypothetical protein [Segniliparus rugosus]|uniref:Uncharacterized protein n=1 Tax=Segniliparus rugosus (strain ATCC BAA-974 / DSM 45345 / CCUG 50838 / CIP 108380 / JCM 13579 / CDC 945) TaxID=679197 RepID=E5XNC8_SEGRC|nr:hypothetical protein [Segniliparus rugosus]EFV14137.2 hypothetical protein HMPREF9336_01054 [Segniliparus rugosus ATCC BAA-974]
MSPRFFRFQYEVDLDFGTAYYNIVAERVRIGDRAIPPEILVDFPGGDNQPSLFMKIIVRNGMPICSELQFVAKQDGPEVRPKDLRSVNLDHWIEVIVGACSSRWLGDGHYGQDHNYEQGINEVRRARKQSHRTMKPDLLKQVAEIYREHFDTGPVQAIQRAFGVSERTAARYVQLCRRDGLLPPTTKGKKQK